MSEKEQKLPRPFLTAEWRHVLMLNYEVDPSVLAAYLPAGTVLDLWQGKALASVVGFLFLNTRLRGVRVPFHTNFEEVNLRFYVRPEDEREGERGRGVVFLKEIVPLEPVARTARWLYRENYTAMPMQHTIEEKNGALSHGSLVEYSWRCRGRINRLGGLVSGAPEPLAPGSEMEFIAEHYWGYTRIDARTTGVYRVEHPSWRAWDVEQPYLLCDVKALYGEAFEPFLHRRPRSAFLAEGSAVAVYPGEKIRTRVERSE